MLISMYSILGWACFCFNYCIIAAWHGKSACGTYTVYKPVALCSLIKISHGFNMNKTKNCGSCSHGNCKLTMVLLLQIIFYKRSIKILFFCGYKNRPKPTIAFKMTYNALHKNNEAIIIG